MSPLLRRSEDGYRQFERAVGPTMFVLSLVFIPVFLLSMVPRISLASRQVLDRAEWAIWIIFLLEYLVRLAIAPDRWRMVRHHTFDLLVILLPFLRVARGFRAVRSVSRAALALGGTVGLGRAFAGARRIARRRGAQYVLLLVSIATAVGALVMLNVEFDAPESNIKTFGDALWWAVSTVTTVGYGDRYPTTTEGRVVAFILMLLGLGLFSVVTARIATFLIVEDSTDDESVHARLGRIEQLLEEHSRMNTRGSETALTSTGTAGLEVVDALPGEAAEADTATLVASAGSSFRGNDVRDEYET